MRDRWHLNCHPGGDAPGDIATIDRSGLNDQSEEAQGLVPSWLDRWAIGMGLASLALVGLATAVWPEHNELIALANVLAWAAAGHAFYKSRQPPNG